MTREEAIETIKDICLTTEQLTRIEKALECLLSQPPLPSNLDEAAEDSWAVYEYRESPRGLYSTCYVDGFKAGVEWMAGQGVTLNLSIDELSCGAYNACVEQGLTSEDDVVIQIRKKQ